MSEGVKKWKPKESHISEYGTKTSSVLHSELLSQIPERVRVKVQAAFELLEAENRLLLEALRLERIRKFGPKSEQFSGELLSLLNLEPVVVE
jgi:hypothetical protein